ncbi:MAG TPA: hypothetical protein VFR96_14470 [Povalibacter sp.]|nr:hypothetical protein [Povalibacter sp.]
MPTRVIRLQVPRFRGRRPEIVVSAIEICDWQRREFGVLDTVQAAHDHDMHPFALRVRALRERLDAAAAAEQMLDAMLIELIPAERVFTLQQSESAGRYCREPRPSLAADRAVASEGPLAQVEIGLVAHRATMATTRI